ncbi:aspartyl protease family protein [uncultured Sphingomonas sp.]|uniref:aspartyl protease family protein n=1 Tax=uncultured Sphingomonas sp. TaxID=158754 RepID=UPI0025927DCC|nr:aspartyl protease family protein [uncultured Sphingomonas sp.]
MLRCCGSVLVGGTIGPAIAGAESLVADWNGFAEPPFWQPFSLVTGDTIVLPTVVAGISVDAILDSGSAASIISASLATRLGLPLAEQRTIRGVGGRASVRFARDVDLALGGQRRRLPVIIVADLDTVSSALGGRVDLILGEDMLAGHRVALDFESRRISVGGSGTFFGGRGWRELSLLHGSNRELLVSASVAGLPAAPMVFDLGNSTALMLSRSFIEEHRLLEGIRQSTAAIGGVEGLLLATTFMVGDVALGGLSVRSVPALAPASWTSASATGSIGFPLISQFDLVLDVSAGKLWLRPARRGLPMLEDHSGFGLALRASELSVVHVAANSPAAAGGWQAGDRIQTVNGRPIDAAYIKGEHWRWRFMPPGTGVRLEDQTGRLRDLRLADYY